MKVIYLKNEGEYKKGDIKEVAEGYFRNFLLPKGIAVLADKINVFKVKQELDKKNKEKKGNLYELQQLAKIINGRKVEIISKANSNGKLYASVSSEDVLLALVKQGIKIKNAKIIFESHIKEAGNYKVKIDLGHGIISEINLVVKVC